MVNSQTHPSQDPSIHPSQWLNCCIYMHLKMTTELLKTHCIIHIKHCIIQMFKSCMHTRLQRYLQKKNESKRPIIVLLFVIDDFLKYFIKKDKTRSVCYSALHYKYSTT